jgi:outer membrane protein assembly factor BamB
LFTGVAPAADWPHWRGPNRNDIVDEPSGWDGGEWRLTEAWQVGAGYGASSPLVIGDRVYVMGSFDNLEYLHCLSAADGATFWRKEYAAPSYGRHATGDQGIYRGISATPEYDPDTGLLYTLGIDGDLRCWDLQADGESIWSLNLYDQYGAGQRPDVGGLASGASRRDYGYTCSPLVLGDTLIVEVGDTANGTVKGFHKRTGAELWTSQCRDEAGHSGGIVPLQVDGVPCAMVLTMRRLLIVRLDAGREGQTFAELDWTTDFANNIPTPAVHGDRVIVTSSYNQSAMCCLRLTPDGLRELWKVENPSGVCSPIIHQGHVYWGWLGIHCIDFESAEERWLAPKVGEPGSCIITSDDRLITLGDRGDLILAETAARSQEGYTELARRRLDFPSECWPHVVLANGRLYCKDRDGTLKCFAVGP